MVQILLAKHIQQMMTIKSDEKHFKIDWFMERLHLRDLYNKAETPLHWLKLFYVQR